MFDTNREIVEYYKEQRDGCTTYNRFLSLGLRRLYKRVGQHGLDALADALND